MNKEVDVLSDVVTSNQNQSAEPTRKATRDSAAAWRDGEVEQDLTNALHQSESSSQGTPPSNTVTQYLITAIRITLSCYGLGLIVCICLIQVNYLLKSMMN